MNLSLKKLWLIICLIILITIYFEINKASRREYYKEKKVKYEEGKEKKTFEFTILICYPLSFDEKHCSNKDVEETIKNSKINCSFEDQIACYYKSLIKHHNISDSSIIKIFEACDLKRLDKIVEEKNHSNFMNESIKYLIEDEKICIKNTYELKFGNETFKYTIKKSDNQDFQIFTSIKRVNHSYLEKEMLIYTRSCYLDDYENCLDKKKKRNYILSINKCNLKNEELDYRKKCCPNCPKLNYSSLTELNIWPAEQESNMNEIDCNQCSIYCHDVYQYQFAIDKSTIDDLGDFNESEVTIEFDANYKELTKKTKVDDFSPFFLIVLYTCVLLNVNLYSLSRLILIYILSLQNNHLSILRRMNVFKLLKIIIALIFLVIFICKLTTFCLDNRSTYQYSSEPLFKNDNVSVTICFNFTDIPKEGINLSQTCVATNQDECSLGQIESLTWNESDFVDRVSVKTVIKATIIRKEEIIILYKDKLKCFNYNYNQPTFVQLLAMMRHEELHIDIEGANYTLFYVQPQDRLPSIFNDILI